MYRALHTWGRHLIRAHICMKGKTTATEIGDALCAHCEKIQIDSPHPSLTHPDRYCAARRRQGPRRRPATHKQFHPFYRENDFNQTERDPTYTSARILCCILPAVRGARIQMIRANDIQRDRRTRNAEERSAYREKCKCTAHIPALTRFLFH